MNQLHYHKLEQLLQLTCVSHAIPIDESVLYQQSKEGMRLKEGISKEKEENLMPQEPRKLI